MPARGHRQDVEYTLRLVPRIDLYTPLNSSA